MAEEYDDFDYIPDDMEEENDYQIKKIEENNRENKNKNLKKLESKNILSIDDETYNFDTINNNKTDSKNKVNHYEEEVEEIKFDDINGESDYKESQKIPLGRNEIDFYENNIHKKNLSNKTNNISSIPVYENLSASTQTKNNQNIKNSSNLNNLNLSTNEMNNKYYNNLSINKDIYENNNISRLETYNNNNNNVNNSNSRYNNIPNDKINLSNISHSRTPKNLSGTKHFSYMNFGNSNNNKDYDPNFQNESHISSNKNKNYYSQNKNEENRSFDSEKRNISPSLNSGYKRNQNVNNNNSEINSFNYNTNNNSYISYKMPSIMDMNSKLIRVGNNNIYSKMQYAETKYDELKNFYSKIQQNFSERKIAELENNRNTEKEKVLDYISKHNYELLKYIDNLNKIINIVIDASKVTFKNSANANNKIIKKYPSAYNNPNINEINNNKLLEVFKKEYLKLDYRYKQIAEASYEEKLEDVHLGLDSNQTWFLQSGSQAC